MSLKNGSHSQYENYRHSQRLLKLAASAAEELGIEPGEWVAALFDEAVSTILATKDPGVSSKAAAALAHRNIDALFGMMESSAREETP